ncbi:MAG: transglycosylase SLT domain-containing protein [Acidobacteriota bacterium]
MEEALAAFRRIWAETPPGPDKTAALAYGRMALLAGDAAAAADPLREVADSRGPLAPHGRLLLAEALLGLGRAEEAEGLARGLTAASSPRLRRRALEILARAQERRGELTPRLETLTRLAALSHGAERDRFLWERARGLLQLERWGEAGRACLDLYRRPECPFGREAGLALRDLAQKNRFRPPPWKESATVEAARGFLRAGRREDALDLLAGLPPGAFEGAAGEGPALLRVEVLLALRRNAETVRAADALLAARGATEAALRASLKAVWALVREGDHQGVVQRCRALLEVPPGGHGGLRAEAQNAWATSAYASGRFAEAEEHWAALEEGGAPPDLLRAARYRRAWSLLRLGRPVEAGALFRALLADPQAGAFRQGARWGLGAAARAAGDGEGEVQALLALAGDEAPYWRAAAFRRLRERGVALAPPPPVLLPSPWTGPAGGPEAALARALDRAGLPAEAADAFQPVYRRYGASSPEAAYTYALLCGRALRRAAAAAALERALPIHQPPSELPAEALEALYPSPFLERIRPQAEAEGLSPALVLAVMLEESGFDAGALSPAGAQGLMQVMPQTATRLLREGEAPPDLFDPGVNTTLGIRYLALLLKRFPTAGAVAAYNAGEEVVARWLAAWKPSSEEEFVAMIPYAETRAYTARVLGHTRLYGMRLR